MSAIPSNLSTAPARGVRAPVAPVEARRAAVVDALAAMLSDNAGLLGDTASLVDWLAEPARRDDGWPLTLAVAAGLVGSLRHHASVLHRAHAARKEALGRLASRAVAMAPDRGAADALRTELADALQALGRSAAERCRRTVASDFGVQSRMAAEVAKTSEADLARELTRQGVRVSLARGLQVDLQQALRRHVEHDVQAMVDEANLLLAELGVMVDRAMRLEFARADACASHRLATATLMERVEDLMQINVRYRGVLPRRGFMHRLAEGRKSIFTVLMFVSLFGSFLGFNWRSHAGLGWVFMAGFIGAVAWTYRSWQDDDHERVEEELEKAREQLRMESRRAVGDIYRELQAAFVEAVESARRVLVGDVEEAARVAAAGAARDSQALRESAQATIRQIESRDAALAAWRQPLPRLEAELLALRTGESA